MKLTNIPGRGGGNAWDYLRKHNGDPHVLAINSPTVISNKLLGVSTTDYSDITPLANLYTEYPISSSARIRRSRCCRTGA